MEPGDERSRQGRKKKRGRTLASDSESDGEPADVDWLLGIAMGCMGMSMDDFCRCTPSEFYAAYEAWGDVEERRERGAWERMRMQCLCSLQPYSKKRLGVWDLMKFPWEEETTHREEKKEELSHDEFMERYKKARERFRLS